MRLLVLLSLLVASAPQAQSLLDAGRDPLTGEPLVLGAAPDDDASGSASGGDLTPIQHLASGSTKLVRFVEGYTFYQDGLDLVLGQIAFPVRGPLGPPVFAETSRYRLPAQPTDAVVVGNRVYVALRKNQGVLMLDLVSASGQFSLVGQISGPDALAVAAAGTTVYVGRGSAGVTAYDVSLPSIPIQLGTVDTPGSANGLALQGSLLAVADGNVSTGPEVRLYNVSTPGAFLPLGTAEAGGFATYAAFHAGRLYVTGDAGLLAFDVTDPATPVLVGSSPADGETTYEVAFDGTTAYVAGLAGLRVVDVSAPAPDEVGAFDPGGQGLSAAVLGPGLVGLADRFRGLHLVEANVPTAPVSRTLVRNGGFSHKGVFTDTHLYVTNLGGGLRIFDTGGGTVVEVGHIVLPSNTQEVLVVGTRAFVTDAGEDGSGLSVVDVTNPAAPVLVGTYAIGESYGMATDAEATTLFVANGFNGLAAFDVQGPAPVRIETYDVGANALDVAVDNDAGIGYVVTFGGGMASLYVADPSNITPLDSEPGFGFLQAIALDLLYVGGDRAFVADALSGLRLVDVTNGADLISVSTTTTASPPRDVAVNGVGGEDPFYTNVYVAEDFAGLRRFEVSAYENAPVTVTGAFASADRGIGVAVSRSALLGGTGNVALMAGEVGVYLFDDLIVSSENGPTTAALTIEAVAPNPVAAVGTVRYRLAAPGAVTVEVLDLLGRRVAVLADRVHAAGAHSAPVDVRALPAGLYVVRVTQSGASATARLAVVR